MEHRNRIDRGARDEGIRGKANDGVVFPWFGSGYRGSASVLWDGVDGSGGAVGPPNETRWARFEPGISPPPKSPFAEGQKRWI